MRHTATHLTGRQVTCTCGWSTQRRVDSQVAGQLIALDHVARVVQHMIVEAAR